MWSTSSPKASARQAGSAAAAADRDGGKSRAVKKVAIMQPYFFPYLGYFQLMAAVDVFILHDRVKYVKKGWINRNRILQNGRDAVISLPLRHGSDALLIGEREVAADFDRAKLVNRVAEAYRKAPCFADTMPLVEGIVASAETNLFHWLVNSLRALCRHLGISTPLVAASSLSVDPVHKGQDLVIALCRAAHANGYINSPGGVDLYTPAAFREAGMELSFLRMLPWTYSQFGEPFVPSLSIIDVLMFNALPVVRTRIAEGYELFLPAAEAAGERRA
jgi:hypothetical protein